MLPGRLTDDGTAIVVELHVIDQDITIGEWCHTCLLPSAVRLPWVAVNPDTLKVAVRGALVACQDCGRHWNDAGDR